LALSPIPFSVSEDITCASFAVTEIREWTEEDEDEMGNMVDPYYEL